MLQLHQRGEEEEEASRLEQVEKRNTPRSEKKVQINTQRRTFFLFNEAETPENRWRKPAEDKCLDCRELFTSQTIKTKRPIVFTWRVRTVPDHLPTNKQLLFVS